MAGVYQGFTMKEAKAKLTEYDMTISHDAESGEYRVNFKGGKEATAYYSNSLVDAVRTGIDMECRRRAS